MQLLIDFYNLLKSEGEIPSAFGVYHIFCICLIITLTVLAVKFLSKCSERQERVFIGISWFIMLFFELAKQFASSFELVGGSFVFDYSWGALPFQFCSMPLYILPLVAFLPNGKVRDGSIVFLATFAIVGGGAAVISADTVFIERIYINIQTMVHHGIQIITGVFLAVRHRDKLDLRGLAKSTVLLLVLAFIALGINIASHNLLGQTLNMFFISPYKRFVPHILSGLGLEDLPFPLFMALYLFAFTMAAALVMLLEILFIKPKSKAAEE